MRISALALALLLLCMLILPACSSPPAGKKLFNLNAEEISKIEFGGNVFLSHVERIWHERTGKTLITSFMTISATYTKKNPEFLEIINLVNSFRYSRREPYVQATSGPSCYVRFDNGVEFDLGISTEDPISGGFNSVSIFETDGIYAYYGVDNDWGERIFEYGINQMLE